MTAGGILIARFLVEPTLCSPRTSAMPVISPCAIQVAKPLALELYGYNLLDQAVYQPEFVGQRINTIPARAGRSVYMSLVWRF